MSERSHSDSSRDDWATLRAFAGIIHHTVTAAAAARDRTVMDRNGTGVVVRVSV